MTGKECFIVDVLLLLLCVREIIVTPFRYVAGWFKRKR